MYIIVHMYINIAGCLGCARNHDSQVSGDVMCVGVCMHGCLRAEVLHMLVANGTITVLL